MTATAQWPGHASSAARHADYVHLVAAGRAPVPEIAQVSASWRRSANRFGIDPVATQAPRILTARELGEQREGLAALVACARPELDQLYAVVRQAGYVVLLCDATGVAIEHRGDDAQADAFRRWGTWLGGVWSEEVEGTNGIGTALAERRPITVHRSQHFRARHTDLSCSGAPIFGVDGSLLAVLDVSAIDPALSEHAHALTGALTIARARAIEERNFREHFSHAWVIAVAAPAVGVPTALLAVDDAQRIIGAGRFARARFSLDDARLRDGVCLWRLFERNPAPFRRGMTDDAASVLRVVGGAQRWGVLVTPPARVAGGELTQYTQPRPDVGAPARNPSTGARIRGGLSPTTLRRIQDYADAHADAHADLSAMAAVAGLSIYHFAREFKRATGVTPHRYVLNRRLEHAKRLLADTDLALSEIALATGFCDQSHLTRRFRQLLGTTPRAYRRSHR